MPIDALEKRPSSILRRASTRPSTRKGRRAGATALAIVIGLLNSACPPEKPAWSQIYADVSNSGQTFAGAPAKQSSAVTQIGMTFESSPVIGSDGSVYVGTITPGSNPPSGDLVHVSGSTLVVLAKRPLAGIISTPAIDQVGNVCVALMKTDGTGAHLISFSSDLSKKNFDVPIPKASSVSSPKILDLPTGGSLIFETYIAAFGSLLIVNEQGQKLRDDQLCVIVEGGGSGFQVPGINLPSVLDPSVGIRQVNRGFFLVMPSNRCGVLFYHLELGKTSSTVPVLTQVGFVENDTFYSSPAISVDGIAVINDSDGNVTGYNITTGDQLWQFQMPGDLFTTPVLSTFAQSFAYSVSSEQLSKVDLVTGNHKDITIIGSVQASPSVGGSSIFVSTKSELRTFDLDLFTTAEKFQFAGDSSSPAVGADGQVYVGTEDGKLFLFPGF